MPQADAECVICARLRDGRPHNGSVGGYLLRAALNDQEAKDER